MEKENRNKRTLVSLYYIKRIIMKKITDIYEEIIKKSTGVFKDRNGDIYYLLNGKHHKSDGPAIEQLRGTKWWYLYGQFHRINGPAIEYSDGDKSWYFRGKLHRSNGPAIEKQNGYKYWYYYGEFADSEKEFYDPEWRRKIEIKNHI